MRRGFTLIEVLVTVTILAIAAAVVVPRIGSKADLELSAATRQVISDLDMARSEAITRNAAVYVSFTTGMGSGGSYSVYKNLTPTYLTNPTTASNWQTTFGVANGFKNVRLSGANFDSKTILMFDETGAPYGVTNGGAYTALASGTITLAVGTATMSVAIEPLTGALTAQ